MFKLFILVALAFLSLNLHSFENESITHIVQKDNLVKSGKVVLSTQNIQSETFTLNISYNLKVSVFFITRNIKGTKNIELPSDFLDPYGYEELQEVGVRDDERARIVYKGRFQSALYYDCHTIHIYPKDNKGWDGEFTYCPTVPSIGFIRTAITMHKVPFVGRHTVQSKIQ
ncbi:MAG: hypothetical protein KC493_11065 [Bacteriovoracaceae bacterium]|nr:hypothetical protein [Bacteriovoracaceae bacterium]